MTFRRCLNHFEWISDALDISLGIFWDSGRGEGEWGDEHRVTLTD